MFYPDFTRLLIGGCETIGQPLPAEHHHTPGPRGPVAEQVLQALVSLGRCKTRDAAVAAALLDSLLRLLRDALAREDEEGGARGSTTWQAVRAFIEEHCDEPIDRSGVFE